MIKLIRFYLKTIGLIFPALLIGSVVVNGIAFVLTWFSKKPAIYLSLPLTTGILIICLMVIGIRLNLKDLKMSSFTLAGMLPVSQGKLLGAKLLTGCGVVLVGVAIQMTLAIGLISLSGHTEIFKIFENSVVQVQEKDEIDGKKSVTIKKKDQDGTVLHQVDIQTEETKGKQETYIAVATNQEGKEVLREFLFEGPSGQFKTRGEGIFNQNDGVTFAIPGEKVKMAGIFGILAIPTLFIMVICFGIYPFIWARYFTKKEFLGKILAVVFIGLMFSAQGTVTDSTGYLLGISTKAARYGPDWISLGWNIGMCFGSYLFTDWLREKKMDLL